MNGYPSRIICEKNSCLLPHCGIRILHAAPRQLWRGVFRWHDLRFAEYDGRALYFISTVLVTYRAIQ